MIHSVYNSLLKQYSDDFYMYIPLSIIFQSCLGSIAAMLILMQGTSVLTFIELMLSVVLCMAYNGALMAQLNVKISFLLLFFSLVINTLLILVNLI